MGRTTPILALLVACLTAAAPARAEQAPDVVVLCDVSLRDPLLAAGQAFRARAKVPVRVFAASLEQNAILVLHGARADVIVGIGIRRIDATQRLGALDRGAPVVIGRNPMVLAVRGTGRAPSTLGSGDTIDALLGGGRLGLVDTAVGSAGPDARESLSDVGLWPSIGPRTMGAETVDGLKQLLDDGLVRVAAVYRTDVAGDPGLDVAATFPSPAPQVAAALARMPESPNAKDFLAFLAGDGQAALRKSGMEPP